MIRARLTKIELPEFGMAETVPAIPAAVHAERLQSCRERAAARGYDVVVLYADRERSSLAPTSCRSPTSPPGCRRSCCARTGRCRSRSQRFSIENSRDNQGVYTPDDRERLRSELIAAARADPRIIGAAITGSAAVGLEDRWSDIDLAFGVRDPSDVQRALGDWTPLMYAKHGAVHHLDVPSGAWIYRVFLLRNTLQVDLAFAPAAEFGARAPTFRLVFGDAVERPHRTPPPAEELIGLAWLYALHARACLARRKLWQAEYMVSAVRDHVLALACRRLDLPAVEGRGMDRLPDEVTRPLEAALVARLESAELGRALRAAVDALTRELAQVDGVLAARLRPTLDELTGVATD